MSIKTLCVCDGLSYVSLINDETVASGSLVMAWNPSITYLPLTVEILSFHATAVSINKV